MNDIIKIKKPQKDSGVLNNVLTSEVLGNSTVCKNGTG